MCQYAREFHMRVLKQMFIFYPQFFLFISFTVHVLMDLVEMDIIARTLMNVKLTMADAAHRLL
jgi:hypothetical protein